MSQPPTCVRYRASRFCAVLVLALCALGTTGCEYLKYRGEDALEMFDAGITLSSSPQLSLYANGASIICFGFSKFHGTLLGMGGGYIGIVRHSNECWGSGLYGREKLIWSKAHKSIRRYSQKQGLYGVLSGRRLPRPAYFPACVHNFHFAFVGIVANIRYAEILDFILGFTTFDLAGDDGRTKGNWFFY